MKFFFSSRLLINNEIFFSFQSFTFRVLILLTWNDPRVMNSSILGNRIAMVVNEEHHSCYWIPKISGQELKSMEMFNSDLTKPNLFLTRAGTIVFLKSYKFIVACSMDLSLYPMDIQQCNISFQAYHLSGFRLRFGQNFDTLRKEATSDLTYDIIGLKKVGESNIPSVTKRLNSSKLTLEFVFKRRLPLYLITTYFPSFLVTIVSFTSFWIHPDAVPGRVTLGVTSLLALMTQMVSVRSDIMNVNYVTTIDIWFLACITFVALSMFEFALAYTVTRNQKIEYMRVNVKEPTRLTRMKWKLERFTTDQWSMIIFPSVFVAFTLVYSAALFELSEQRRKRFVG